MGVCTFPLTYFAFLTNVPLEQKPVNANQLTGLYISEC